MLQVLHAQRAARHLVLVGRTDALARGADLADAAGLAPRFARAVDLEDSNLFALNRFPGYDRWEDGSRVTYGVDWAFECSGHPVALRASIDCLEWGGTAVAVDGDDRGIVRRVVVARELAVVVVRTRAMGVARCGGPQPGLQALERAGWCRRGR